jgi:cysteine desulfurase/selenocysteine lyase
VIASLVGTEIESFRQDFPILSTEVRGTLLAYLDNAATAQKPQHVMDVLDRYWAHQNANVHRGVHYLSQIATAEFDAARVKVQTLLNAAQAKEVIFTRGCTESVNLVATCLTSAASNRSTNGSRLTPRIVEGDEILISAMEHHSNIVPWQLAAERVGAILKVIPITDSGEIDMDAYAGQLSPKTKMVGIVHVSNSLGTVNPVKQMIKMAHAVGALVLVDGAQAGPHLSIDVQDLDADFYTLSCHKIYAPTGVGVLYGKRELLEAMPPYQGGGDMIRTVSFERTTYAELPAKYEAGTPNVAGVIGLGAAIDYLMNVGRKLANPLRGNLDDRSALMQAFSAIHEREAALASAATQKLQQIPGVRVTGTAPDKAGIVSFTMDSAHPHDIGTILDGMGIAIRAGHHCCMPLMNRLGVPATARASFAFYNTFEEVDRLVSGVHKIREMFI